MMIAAKGSPLEVVALMKAKRVLEAYPELDAGMREALESDLMLEFVETYNAGARARAAHGDNKQPASVTDVEKHMKRAKR